MQSNSNKMVSRIKKWYVRMQIEVLSEVDEIGSSQCRESD